MEQIVHRKHEQYFIDIDRLTIMRNNFDSFLEYIHQIRKDRAYGFNIKIEKAYADLLPFQQVNFGEPDSEVDELLTRWATLVTNFPFFYALIHTFELLNEDNKPYGKIYYWNFYTTKKEKMVESSLFPIEMFSEVKTCFYDLRRFMTMAMTPASEFPYSSEFEVMDSADKYYFQKLLPKAENLVQRMENTIKDIEKAKESWKFIHGRKDPYFQLKKVYEVASSKFTY